MARGLRTTEGFHATPIVVNEGSQVRRRIESAFDEFRQIFPAALCYTKIVPVDEVVTLTFSIAGRHLRRLMPTMRRRRSSTGCGTIAYGAMTR